MTIYGTVHYSIVQDNWILIMCS